MLFCSYENLLLEERQTNQEIMAFQRKMEAWPTSTTSSHTTTTATTTTSTAGIEDRGRGSDTALPPAVVALEVCTVYYIHSRYVYTYSVHI